MKTKSVVAYAVMLSAALALPACGKKVSEQAAEKVIEKSMRDSGEENAHVDISHGNMKLKSDKGEMEIAGEGGSASLPSDFPKDVFVDPKAQIQVATKTPDGFTLTLVSNGSLADTAKRYDDEIKAHGWTQDANMDIGSMHTSVYKKADRELTVMASAEDPNEITVNIAVQDKK